ncbi:uncharacterized protein PGTG_15330 [Puccinia graminis f. sp. tritici CRL 75-36-700-3]|uniref:FGAR-AT PurM N-terminal-like domain-containing protein n=1 Tax=Puccinia graminis f. sp. tritici (strain CRL 75-36-700-3 / race SCCL) TaxID=418459 RepID=E3KYU2_PUCGT|nr:uncharacterized protein PGTG_15330 [Puccinia graminis f. sp. tritici CRL 75-36-700-3]EFP89488.2 hypothetical protein PGTG_15330 [Puccinia graminis f. sp. tritici CRL 75-36-700-3]
MGKRSPLSLISAASSAKMVVAEVLTNLVAADINSLEHVKLSAHWMCSASHGNESAWLFEVSFERFCYPSPSSQSAGFGLSQPDGGLFVSSVEMSFVACLRLQLTLPEQIQTPEGILSFLFNEEAGAVIQCEESKVTLITETFAQFGLPALCI